MRGPAPTLALSALMSAAVLLGFLGLEALQGDEGDTLLARIDAPRVGTSTVPEPHPAETVALRVYAPRGRCWAASVAGRRLRDGCGSDELALDVADFVLVRVERLPGGEGEVTAIFEDPEGRVVQTVGPTSDTYPSFDIAYTARPAG
jgi:hypothetical protein